MHVDAFKSDFYVGLSSYVFDSDVLGYPFMRKYLITGAYTTNTFFLY